MATEAEITEAKKVAKAKESGKIFAEEQAQLGKITKTQLARLKELVQLLEKACDGTSDDNDVAKLLEFSTADESNPDMKNAWQIAQKVKTESDNSKI
ncbi:MAG: hypothetical protein NY202_05190 [Mollicutes bacterium UO1]